METTISIPQFLRDEDLVLLRPLVADEVRVATGLKTAIAQNIAEYVTPAHKVETTRMIEFFQTFFGSGLPQAWLAAQRREILERRGWWFLDEPPTSDMHPDAYRLKMSPERKLVAFIGSFFLFHMYPVMMSMPDEAHQTRLINHIAASEARVSCLNRIVGLARVDEEIVDATRDCKWYVFRHHAWFSEVQGDLLTDLESVLEVLIDRGYTIATRAAPGQVAVYHTMTSVMHYGRVESVDPSGEITVLSKWNTSPVFRHRAGVLGPAYGYRILFLNPPT